MSQKLLEFDFPSPTELEDMGRKNRINIFRRYFATSRYNRLLIQIALVRSALDKSSIQSVSDLEYQHNQDFIRISQMMDQLDYHNEYLEAVREEETALEKIIEAFEEKLIKLHHENTNVLCCFSYLYLFFCYYKCIIVII